MEWLERIENMSETDTKISSRNYKNQQIEKTKLVDLKNLLAIIVNFHIKKEQESVVHIQYSDNNI